jgi:hypothetical protein
MAISAECPQGHNLRVKDDFAGKKVRCPKCQAVVQVGQKPDSRSRLQESEEPDSDSFQATAISGSRLPAPPRRSQRTKKSSQPEHGSAWKVPLLVGAGVLVVAGLVTGGIVFARKSVPTSDSTATDSLRARPVSAAESSPFETKKARSASSPKPEAAKPLVHTVSLVRASSAPVNVATDVASKPVPTAQVVTKQAEPAVLKGVFVWDTVEPGRPRGDGGTGAQEGWERIASKQGKSHRFRGDCVIENENVLLRTSRDQRYQALLTAKAGVGERATVPISLFGHGAKPVGPLSINVASLSGDSATIEYGAEGTSGPRVACHMESGKFWVEFKSLAKADRLAIGVKSQFLVVPSEFGEDLVCDALKCKVGQSYPLPSENLVLALQCDGNFMTVLTYPSIDQAGTATVGSGEGVQNHGAALNSQVSALSAKFNGKSVFVGMLPQKDNWYYEPVNKKYSASGQYIIPWHPPYVGVWRLVGRVNGRYFVSDVPDDRFVFACSLSGSIDCLFSYFDGPPGNPATASPLTIYREMLERTGNTTSLSRAEGEDQGRSLMRQKTRYRDVCNSVDDMKDAWRNRPDTLQSEPDHVSGLLGDCKAIIARMDRRMCEYQELTDRIGEVVAQMKEKTGAKEGAELKAFAAVAQRNEAKLKAIKLVAAAPGVQALDTIEQKLQRQQGRRLDVAELDRIAESAREVANNQEEHLKKLREITLQLAQACTKQRKTMSPTLKPYVTSIGWSCRKVLRTRDPEE